MSAATGYAYPHRNGTKVKKKWRNDETEKWRNGKNMAPLFHCSTSPDGFPYYSLGFPYTNSESIATQKHTNGIRGRN